VARTVSDDRLLAEIRQVHAVNYGVYGARKMWWQLRRSGYDVARCTVERFMRDAGLAGAVRGKKVRTAIVNPDHQRAGDLIRRDFTAEQPNRRWVAIHCRLSRASSLPSATTTGRPGRVGKICRRYVSCAGGPPGRTESRPRPW
jgi:transposase InsO family protein